MALTHPEPRTAAAEGGERAGKWTVLAIVGIGVFMATLDASIVNISLPVIAELAATGLLVSAVGLVLVARLHAGSPLAEVAAILGFIGVGQALFQPPNNSALMGSAPRSRQGVAAGMLATSRVVGQSVSVALAGAIFGSLGGERAGRELVIARASGAASAAIAPLEAAFTHALHVVFVGCAAIALVGVLASLVRGKGA